jgi:hypothetical protein
LKDFREHLVVKVLTLEFRPNRGVLAFSFSKDGISASDSIH